jgi:antitoxin component YwqK of YwqJK toxin-antitoxin module
MVSYSGETDENNTPHGIGVMIMKNGDIYKGSFVHGKRHGEGAVMTKKGVKLGKWKDNHEDGELKEVKNGKEEQTDGENGDIENGGIVKFERSVKGARAPM